MATLATTAVTFAEAAKRQDPDGKIAAVVEILQETNEILEDAMTMEANDGTGHRTTIRSQLPTAYWRKLNQGVPNSKSKTKQVRDETGSLEVYSEVDKDIADLNGNTAAFRLSEDAAFLEAMNQEMGDVTFYGDTTVDAKEFHGLSSRYSDLSAGNAENIIDAGGTGSDNTSIWLVTWGDASAFYLHPKGSEAGLQADDKGQQTLQDSSGNQYEGYRTHYQWKLGLVLKNWKSVVRIANIDVSDLTKDGSGSSADLIDLMVQAVEQRRGAGKVAFYCNRTIRSYLRRQISNKSNVNLSLGEVAGKKAILFDEYPIRLCEALLNTEARVV